MTFVFLWRKKKLNDFSEFISVDNGIADSWVDLYNPSEVKCYDAAACNNNLKNADDVTLETDFGWGEVWNLNADSSKRCVKLKSDPKFQEKDCGSSLNPICASMCSSTKNSMFYNSCFN